MLNKIEIIKVEYDTEKLNRIYEGIDINLSYALVSTVCLTNLGRRNNKHQFIDDVTMRNT